MATFKNINDIEKDILEKAQRGIGNVRDDVYKVIDKHLLNYYGEYNPELYLRTSRLLNSLVKTNVIRSGNQIKAEVYFDLGALNYSSHPTILMRVSDMKMRSTRKEYTVSAQADPAKTLESAMEGGHGGAYTGTPIWYESMAELKDITALIVKELRSMGISIK